VERQLKGLNEATKKYGMLHSLISVSSKGIKDGIETADDSIQKITERTEQVITRIEKSLISCQGVTKASRDASEQYIQALKKLQDGINTHVEERVKKPTAAIMKSIEDETRGVLKKSRMKANISLVSSIICMATMAILIAFSWSPLSNYSRDLERKFAAYYDAYNGLKDSVCAIKSNRSISELQSKICDK